MRWLVLLLVCCTVFAADLQPGKLPASWITGGPNCITVPDWQVHEYNDDFYILRESGCIHYEKPFLYLIFGQDKALLEDTGAGAVQTAPFVMSLIERWAKRKGRQAPVPLIVVHSHSHGDHTAGDKQLQALPKVEFLKPHGPIDLGQRVIDVIPIPGHDAASIALYDRLTGNLLTGDSQYPGRLYVREADVPVYAESAKRLADFARTHAIANVLGTHIEQSRTPYVDYPRGTAYQPDEHVLELKRAHIFELEDAFAHPETYATPEFTIVVRKR